MASLDGAASDEIEKLREVANVVMEAPNGPVAQAFSVTAWPALCRVDENGVISTTDHDSVVGSWVSG